MLSQVDNCFVCGVDLDSCRDPETEAIAPWAQTVIDRLDTYAEVSPRRTAVKCFSPSRAPIYQRSRRSFAADIVASSKRDNGTDRPPAIEVFRGHRFFAVTWEAITATDDLRLINVADLNG